MNGGKLKTFGPLVTLFCVTHKSWDLLELQNEAVIKWARTTSRSA